MKTDITNRFFSPPPYWKYTEEIKQEKCQRAHLLWSHASHWIWLLRGMRLLYMKVGGPLTHGKSARGGAGMSVGLERMGLAHDIIIHAIHEVIGLIETIGHDR
jgi:hypothetical protein